MSVNKAILIGNIGRDVETRQTAGGMTVAKFSLATSDRRKDQSGQWQDHTEWHNIVAFGKLGEFAGQYLAKGRTVYVEGSIRTRTYDDEKGNRRYFTEIIAQAIRFVGPKPQGGGAPQAAPGPSGDAPEFPPEGGEDDIPF
ncbi:MAG TPA: single-stranded DNA-binding protein [Thermoanaerobaculaceae bacterium]|nr:single-stranded DNA-binding protein [Thermoanaerobaculaceae bacterium]